MKLLTPSQNNELRQVEVSREILRVEELRKATAKARRELAAAEADFNSTLARNRHKWAGEEEAHNQRLKEMARELDVLEDRKAKALIPISMYKEQADIIYNQAVEALKKARLREGDAEDLNTRLQDKLDGLGQKEQDLIYLEKQLVAKAQGIAIQSEQIIEGNKKLTQEILNFGLTRTKAEVDIDERKTALYLWDRTLGAKEETLKNTDRALTQLATQLKDERGTLDRAWAELERKKKKLLSP